MRRFTSFSGLLLASLVVAACGDDNTDTTSSGTGGGGDEGGSDGAGGAPSTTTVTASTGETTTSSSSSTTTTSAGGNGAGGGEGGGPPANCGDGNDDLDEQCDDGNQDDTDGCTTACVLTFIADVCGNGLTEASVDEDCDDGNDVSWDGCENDCTVSPAEVVCEELAPLGGGGCEVEAGGDNKLLIGDVLLNGSILRGGQVAIDDAGTITCIGCDCAAVEPDATTITCPEGSISPGLINTHEHITYAHNDPAADTGERYEHRHEWRRGLNGHTEIPAPGGGSAGAVRFGELRFLLSGATSLVGSGEATGFLRNLDRAAKEGLSAPSTNFETFPLNDSDGDMIESGCGYEDIDSQESIALDLAYLPHISEGINTAARNEFLCVSGSPGEDLLQHQSSFIHGVGLRAEDYAAMAADGTSLIWSPRSNVVLYGNTAQATIAARAGVNIALGTDWILSGSHNMFRELQCAALLNDDYFDGFFTRRDLWRMVTAGAARALGLEQAVGSLQEGLLADVAIYDASSRDGYAAVVDGEANGVHLVLRGGEPLYGDTSVLDALPDTPADCETPFDTCMADKTICVESETGNSYAELESQAGAAYGPYFCTPPADEPTCVPSRGEAVDGSTVYSGTITLTDDDGDGILDVVDNCPTVFNPVRPMDGGEQPDEDADDLGDPCDPCPLEADVDDCVGIDPADEDADGHPNTTDNCPYSDNPTQADNDDDGHGNECDVCPSAPNPGYAPCAVTIYDLKTGDAAGPVFVSDVLVTACAEGQGFFVQHAPGDAAYDGPENSGIYVYDPGVVCGADVSEGDRLDISGETDEFFLQIQLGFAEYQVTGQDALPDPVVLTVAEASGEEPNGYEGVLARVEDVTVTDIAPAPGPGESGDTGEFEVGGALRVDDFIFASLPIPEQGASFASITGPLIFKNGNQKIEPRDAGDLVP